ncbi:hypothetical protein [Pseudomonas sp.]|uniref:hypothetical protein n=1 Tax=Pseudomonas sp. TaxID=306 RepID=UPI003CC588D4
MNPLSVLRDSLYFFRRNLAAIAQLCLPLVVLEALATQMVQHTVGPDASPLYDISVGLLFYPLYTGALILFLDARSKGLQPLKRNLLAVTLRMWPYFALLAASSTLLIMLGISLFVLPGLYVMVKLVFAEYLLVLRGLTPMAAMRDSFQLTQGHFLRIMTCVFGALVPLWAIDIASNAIWPDPSNWQALMLDSINGFLQLFTSVVVYRLFMLRMENVDPA